ncbi:MAG: hypothetical protein HY043_21065 [Verrucomicrobia bacterium]|nr:hypothetical protein [Verrucomicrobiota bacterium]
MKKCLFITGCLFALIMRVSLGAAFQNLDFEMVNTNTSTLRVYPEDERFLYGGGPIADLLPGWQITNGGVKVITIAYNAYCGSRIDGGDAGIGIFQPGAPPYKTPDYALFFSDCADFSTPTTLSQRGDVPTNAVGYTITGNFPVGCDVRINDIIVGGQGGNVAAYAGQNVELKLTISYQLTFAGFALIDSFQFITAPHVEPESLSYGTNGFSFSWTNHVSTTYQVEYAASLPGVWRPIGGLVTSTNGIFTFTDDPKKHNPFVAQHFYRLRWVP